MLDLSGRNIMLVDADSMVMVMNSLERGKGPVKLAYIITAIIILGPPALVGFIYLIATVWGY